jgi:holliday junction DNA helicase RuvB
MFDSIRQIMSKLLAGYLERQKTQIFDHVIGYNGIKRTFLRSLNSEEPVHILLVGSPGQAKTMFLKSILQTFGEKKAFFTVGCNASKSGLIDVLFDLRPKYLLTDEIEHLRSEYQTILLSLMETNTNSDYAQ